MSYSIYVGRNRTVDGVGFLSGYGDEPSSHWLEVIPRQFHEVDSSIEVGVTPDAQVPGKLMHIPQVGVTARHLRVSYSHYKGHPSPLSNGGLNEHGVAVRDVWSASRPELLAMTPSDQTGPNYSDLAKLVLERAKTAREGVELIGALIAQYGHCTYGGNSHMIADAHEGWVVIEFAGGRGLWVAERLGPDDIRISRPGYIGEMPLEEGGSDRFLHSENFVEFAVSMGWYDPTQRIPFNVNSIYGDGRGRWEGVQWAESELCRRSREKSGLVLADMIWALRSERLTGDSAGYGQIVPLLGRQHPPEMRIIWHAHIGAVAAPFIPVFLGVADIPQEFRQHRYLSAGEAERFYGGERVNHPAPTVPRSTEARRSATEILKRLYYLLLEDGSTDVVASIWHALESKLAKDADIVARIGVILRESGESDLLSYHLTYFTKNELANALRWAESLASATEVRLAALRTLGATGTAKDVEQIW